eukprot:GFUD01012948.1.p1 GENE.GFUD01012948.1~~GFUD01012948.1.p1  ORF type:complete len:111 (+),score=3.43 GFUD01012948.1:618-950(+)
MCLPNNVLYWLGLEKREQNFFSVPNFIDSCSSNLAQHQVVEILNILFSCVDWNFLDCIFNHNLGIFTSRFSFRFIISISFCRNLNYLFSLCRIIEDIFVGYPISIKELQV